MVTNQLKKRLNIEQLHCIGINWKGEILGGLHIFTQNKQQIPDKTYIETFIAHIASVINSQTAKHNLGVNVPTCKE